MQAQACIPRIPQFTQFNVPSRRRRRRRRRRCRDDEEINPFVGRARPIPRVPDAQQYVD